MIKKYSLLLLQKAINKALSLDDNIKAKIKSLEGKSLEIVVAPLEVSFYIVFTNEQLILLDSYDEKIDTTIYSNPLGLIRLSFLPASKARSLFNDKIRMSGDVEVGMQVKQLFDNLDIDWEGHLASFTGDVVAYQVGSWVKKGLAFTEGLHQSLTRNTTDYIQEEVRLSPSLEEVNDFLLDVDSLSHDVARLDAKIASLSEESL